MTSGPADVPGAAGVARVERRRGGQELEHVAPVDRLRAVRPPRRQREHGQALDQPHEEAERARAGGDDDRRAQRDRLGRGLQQRALDGQPRREMARQRAVGGQQPAEVDDPPHAGGGRRARERLGLAALEVDEGSRAGPSIEWIR